MNTVEAKERTYVFGEKYEIEYDAEFVRQHILLPEDPANIPNIIGWSGPARSGTTALLFLLAGCSRVDRVYFQPQQTLQRFGYPSIELHETDKLVCMKETFFSWKEHEAHNPIETLLRAGVPPEKITWIAMLRDPLQTFRSWEQCGDVIPPDAFAFCQSHTVELWRKYKDSGVNIVPFAYELMRGQEERVIRKLLPKIGIDVNTLPSDLSFNRAMIDKKLVPGQAASEEYFNLNLRRTINRGKYIYTTNSYSVEVDEAREVIGLCQEEYDMFLEEAKRTLEL